MTAFIINVQEELHAETVDRRGSQDSCDLPWLATQPVLSADLVRSPL